MLLERKITKALDDYKPTRRKSPNLRTFCEDKRTALLLADAQGELRPNENPAMLLDHASKDLLRLIADGKINLQDLAALKLKYKNR